MKFQVPLAFILLSAILGCNAVKPTEQERTIDVIPSGKDVNQSITLSAPEGWNTYKTNDPIYLSVVPNSVQKMVLKENNLAIYQLVNNDWTLIENDNPHPPMEVIIVPSEVPAASTVQVVAIPKLLAQSGDIKLLFVISANIYENEVVGDEVKAYTEVTLNP
jgi:hypothetical protein